MYNILYFIFILTLVFIIFNINVEGHIIYFEAELIEVEGHIIYFEAKLFSDDVFLFIYSKF